MSDDKAQPDARIDRLLAQLPREIAPATDLWPAIERGMVDQRTGPTGRTTDDTAEAPSETGSESNVWSQLQPSVEPERDLWPGIASQLEPRPARRVFNWAGRRDALALLAACIVVIAVGGLLFFGSGGLGTRVAPDAGLVADQPGGQSSVPSGDGFAADLLFPGSADAATSDAQNVYREHIAIVRGQRVDIEASLDQYPDDSTLRALWRHTYETELLLIDQAGRLLSTI